jgi:hypothetical protein
MTAKKENDEKFKHMIKMIRDKFTGVRMKIGIIRCQQTEDMCPGTTDSKVASEGKSDFAEIGPSEIIGFVSCGGCPGKKAIPRALYTIRRVAVSCRERAFLQEC